MKKLFKILAVLVGLCVFLVIAGTVALRIFLPPAKAKALVLERLSTQLKREVQLGSVSVGLLSGLVMTDLKISESPNFAKGTFVSSKEFSLKIGLLPLLFRKVIVRQILLKQPEVTVIRNADGKTFNFSDLANPTTSMAPTPSPAKPKESLPFLLLISRAEIQKGALHFADRSPSRQSTDITPFDLKLKNVSLTTPFSVETTLHVKSKGTDLAIAFAGQANLLKGNFVIKQGSLTSQGTKIKLSGELKDLKTPSPAVDLVLDVPQLKLADFAAFFVLPPAIKIDQPIKASASVKGDEKKLDLKAQIVLESLKLDGHGQIQNPKAKPVIAFHVETNAFPIQEALKYAPGYVPEGVALEGTTRISADLSGPLENTHFAAKWVGTDLRVAKGEEFLKPAGVPLEASIIGDRTAAPERGAAPSSGAAGKITVTTLVAKLSANQVSGSGTIEPRGKDSYVNFTAKGANWSVQDLAKISPLVSPYHPTGTVSFEAHMSGLSSAPQTTLKTSANIDLADIKQEFYEGKNLHLDWNLTDITPDLSKVNGKASLKQGPGKILNVEKLASSSRIGKIALAPLETLAKIQKKGVLQQVNIPSLESLPFDSVVGDYVLRTGVMTIKSFNLNGKVLSIENQGTVGLFGTQSINLKVVMKLAVGSIGGTLGNILKDDMGIPVLKFAATGTVADPQVKFDAGEVVKKATEELGKELMKNKDVQNAVDDLQKTFKGIFH